MSMNMGGLDRAVRLAIAAVLVVLAFFTGLLGPVLFWVALAVAAIFVLTAVVGNCPLYSMVGLRTCKDC